MTPALLVLSLALVSQATPPVSPPRPQTTTTSTRPGSLHLTVMAQAGSPLLDALVRAEGPATRQGTTSADGVVTLLTLPAGTYRVRIEREGFYTLEKEITIRAGARTTSEAALTPAPPPPPPPAPPTPSPTPTPTPASPALTPGEPKLLDVAALFEQMLKEPAPVAERALGCSGATATRLIRANGDIASHSHADADETIYVLSASRVTINIGGRDQNIDDAAWVGIVPRGVTHAITRRDRKPIMILSVLSGPPCPTVK